MVAAACLTSSLALADRDNDRRGSRSDERKDDRQRAELHVPPGHLPAPGKCRVWYLDRPPGHQPAPGDCRELSDRLPRGAILIEG